MSSLTLAPLCSFFVCVESFGGGLVDDCDLPCFSSLFLKNCSDYMILSTFTNYNNTQHNTKPAWKRGMRG